MKVLSNYTLIVLVGFIPLVALADIADDAWLAYLAGDFSRVAQIVQTGIPDSSLTSNQKAKLYFTLGCSQAMQGKDFAAADAFRIAFTYNPDLKHSSMELPPPVWRVFKPIQDSTQAKLTFDVKRVTESTGIKVRIDTVRVIETLYHKPQAVFRSLAYPGWGHLYEGDKSGYSYTIGETVLLAGFITSLQLTADAREKYSEARTPSDIDKYYSRYNLRYKLSWGLGTAAACFYLFNQWDFFSNPPAITITSISPSIHEIGFRFTM